MLRWFIITSVFALLYLQHTFASPCYLYQKHNIPIFIFMQVLTYLLHLKNIFVHIFACLLILLLIIFHKISLQKQIHSMNSCFLIIYIFYVNESHLNLTNCSLISALYLHYLFCKNLNSFILT